MKKSYDVSSNFSSNQKKDIKAEFCFSPAMKEDYNYKSGIVKEFHIGGLMTEEKPMYSKSERKDNSELARFEKAKANY